MRNIFAAWWHWAGPDSPIGIISGVFIFFPSVVIAGVVLFPPLWWLLRHAVGPWWAFWSAL